MKLIGYLSNGYPTLEDSKERALRYVKNGVEIIEADFPAADPYLDNDLLKSRIFKARENTTDYDVYMDAILELHKELPEIQIMINIYEETVMEIGVEKFVAFMAKLNENRFLLAGNRFPELREELESHNLFMSSFVTRDMNEELLELAEISNGFIYLEGFGDESKYSKEYPELKDCLNKTRSIIGEERDIYCGIGVHTPELVKEVYEAGADGVFLGSLVIKLEDDLEAQSALIRELALIANGKK